MSDTAVKNAIARRAELASEVGQHERAIKAAKMEILRIDHFIKSWIEFAEEDAKKALGEIDIGEGIEALEIVVRSDKKPLNPKKEEVAEAAIKVICKVGRPLPRAELFQALQAEGIHIEGKDPEMVLSTMLWRMKEKVVRLKPYGYWPADRPFEDGGYHPSGNESPELPGIRVRKRMKADKSASS